MAEARLLLGWTASGIPVEAGINRSVLILGNSGSGKTNTLLTMLKRYSSLGECYQAVIFDSQRVMNAGERFTVVNDPMTQYASALQALSDECQRRAKALSEAPGAQSLPATLDFPHWLVVMDEVPSIWGNLGAVVAKKSLRTELQDMTALLMRTGRKYGLTFVLSSQSPMQEALGSTQFRALCDERVLHKMNGDEEIRQGSGADPSELPSHGLLRGEFWARTQYTGGAYVKARSESPDRMHFGEAMGSDAHFKRIIPSFVERGFESGD